MSVARDIVFKQASDVYLDITGMINGEPLTSISAAKYIICNLDGDVVVERTLGNGISFNAGVTTVHITDQDSLELTGQYTHECVVKDTLDNDIFILTGRVRVIPTKARI